MRSTYRKVRARRAWDFALAGLALAVQIEEEKVRHARVVFSGVAPVPWRSREVEESILGKRLDKETIAKAADAFLGIDDNSFGHFPSPPVFSEH
ncbi:MAG: hypothetical protein R6X07_09575 [Desulfatiglandales bacterium]